MKIIKIISVFMYSSLQILLNIIKSPETTPKVISQGSMRNSSQTAHSSGSDLTRYGEWDSSPHEYQGLARCGELDCSPRE